jgi:Ca2+/Na+ antiporter
MPAADTHTVENIEHEDHHGLLRWMFSQAGADEGHWLQRHRSQIALSASIGLACFEYGTLGAMSAAGYSAMIVASGLVAHDASEDLLDAASKLQNSHGITGGVVGVAMGAAHTASEFLMTAFARSAQNSGAYSDMVVATTMGSNVSHIWLMTGVAGVVGAVSVDRFSAWKMNAVALGSMTAAFGWQVVTGEFNPYLSAGMVGGAVAFLSWRVQAGQTCATCPHTGTVIDQPDSSSINPLPTNAAKLSLKGCSEALTRLNESVQDACRALYFLPLKIEPKKIGTKLKELFNKITHPNVTTLATSLGGLAISAHIMGNNVVKLAEGSSLSTTALGASVAALAFALPELILTAKAAWKKSGDMAWGAITGCTVATVGIVGGYQGLSGFEVPQSLSFLTIEGKVQMGAFLGSAATIIAATSPWGARILASIDNWFADRLKNKWERASGWLRNDGTKISKASAAAMTAAAIAFYMTSTLPICHSHGKIYHCYNPAPEPLPSAQEAQNRLQNALPDNSPPDF